MKTFALKTVKCKIIQNKNRLRSGLRAETFLELQPSSQFPQLSKSGINRFVMSHDPSKLIPVTYFCKPPHIWDTKYHSMVNGIFLGGKYQEKTIQTRAWYCFIWICGKCYDVTPDESSAIQTRSLINCDIWLCSHVRRLRLWLLQIQHWRLFLIAPWCNATQLWTSRARNLVVMQQMCRHLSWNQTMSCIDGFWFYSTEREGKKLYPVRRKNWFCRCWHFGGDRGD